MSFVHGVRGLASATSYTSPVQLTEDALILIPRQVTNNSSQQRQLFLRQDAKSGVKSIQAQQMGIVSDFEEPAKHRRKRRHKVTLGPVIDNRNRQNADLQSQGIAPEKFSSDQGRLMSQLRSSAGPTLIQNILRSEVNENAIVRSQTNTTDEIQVEHQRSEEILRSFMQLQDVSQLSGSQNNIMLS